MTEPAGADVLFRVSLVPPCGVTVTSTRSKRLSGSVIWYETVYLAFLSDAFPVASLLSVTEELCNDGSVGVGAGVPVGVGVPTVSTVFVASPMTVLLASWTTMAVIVPVYGFASVKRSPVRTAR